MIVGCDGIFCLQIIPSLLLEDLWFSQKSKTIAKQFLPTKLLSLFISRHPNVYIIFMPLSKHIEASVKHIYLSSHVVDIMLVKANWGHTVNMGKQSPLSAVVDKDLLFILITVKESDLCAFSNISPFLRKLTHLENSQICSRSHGSIQKILHVVSFMI